MSSLEIRRSVWHGAKEIDTSRQCMVNLNLLTMLFRPLYVKGASNTYIQYIHMCMCVFCTIKIIASIRLANLVLIQMVTLARFSKLFISQFKCVCLILCVQCHEKVSYIYDNEFTYNGLIPI